MIGNSIIKLENVDVYQQKHLVLSNVNLHIDKGDFVWLIGQTGSGKSSLLKIIYGDLSITNGNGHACGYDLKNMPGKDIPFLRRKLGIVFQDFQLLTDRTVEQNLEFVMRATGWKDKKLIMERTLDVLEKVGLRSKLKKMPHELSGGEQQRVVIARAMINDPEIILADEPTGNLDPDTSEEIVLLLKQISLAGTSVLIATHDYHIIRAFPSRIIKCESGKVIEDVQMESVNYTRN
jgi:cell division transport system ATP-binding protein